MLLTDGTQLLLEGGGGGTMREGDKTMKLSYYIRFDVPIPRKDIDATILSGTVYMMDASKAMKKRPASAGRFFTAIGSDTRLQSSDTRQR